MHLRHLILSTLVFASRCDKESNVISKALITYSSNFTKHNMINKAIDGLFWTKPAHFISATLTISNDIMPTTLTQTITCSKPSSSLLSNQKLKLNYYSLLLFKNCQKMNNSFINQNIALQANNLFNVGVLWQCKRSLVDPGEQEEEEYKDFSR